MNRIALVYEISGNPYFGAPRQRDDRLSEYVQPSEVNEILRTLNAIGYDVAVVDGPTDLLARAPALKAEMRLVFNKSIGETGLERKIVVPAICQLYGIPILGTSGYGMTLARHKYHTNRLLKGIGLPVPDAQLFSPGDVGISWPFGYPAIVKPNHESDSLGISMRSVVHDHRQLVDGITELHREFGQAVIVEKYLPGEEWRVPVVGNGPDAQSLGCVGVAIGGKPLLGSLQTRDDVIHDRMTYYSPDNAALSLQAMQFAQRIHCAFGLQDYSRCDFRLDDTGSLFCLEVSTHPDLGPGSSFRVGAEASISTFDDLISKIVNCARLRYSPVA